MWKINAFFWKYLQVDILISVQKKVKHLDPKRNSHHVIKIVRIIHNVSLIVNVIAQKINRMTILGIKTIKINPSNFSNQMIE